MLVTIFFILLVVFVKKGSTSIFDNNLLNSIAQQRTQLATKAMQFATLLGGTIGIAIALLYSIYLYLSKHRKYAIGLPLTIIGGFLTNVILKQIFAVSRPTLDPLQNLSSYSFPSGHSMNAMITYSAICYILLKTTLRLNQIYRQMILIGTALIIILVGFSRTYLGVHYPSDVIGGFTAGALYLLIILYFYTKISRAEKTIPGKKL